MNSKKGRSRKRRQIHGKKVLLTSLAVLLLGAAAAGTSMAFLVDKTNQLTNTFTPSAVTGEIDEDFDGTIKKDVAIKNTGDINAYVRVALVPNWADDAGNIAAEVEAGDYELILSSGEDSKWIQGDDGFYYYREAVLPGATTEILVKSCEPLVSKTDVSGNKLHFVLHVVASLIQAEPSSVVEEAWSVEVDENGTITKP